MNRLRQVLILAAAGAAALPLLAPPRAVAHAAMLVSATPGGAPGAGPSSRPSLNADGRYVAFTSDAPDLVSADANAASDVFRRDVDGSLTVCVSVSQAGVPANGASRGASISGDGTLIVFASDATNLVPDDTNTVADVFLRDVPAGVTTLVSTGPAGQPANGPSAAPRISADGRYVVFASKATNIVPDDTNRCWDIFRWDRQTGETMRVSMTTDGSQPDLDCWQASISGDGALVAYRVGDLGNGPGAGIACRDLANGTVISVPDDTGFNDALWSTAREAPVICASGAVWAYAAVGVMLQKWGTPYFVSEQRRQSFESRILSTGTAGARLEVQSPPDTVNVTPAYDDRFVFDPALSGDGRFIASGCPADPASRYNLIPMEGVRVLDVFSHAEVCTVPDAANPTLDFDGRYLAYEMAGQVYVLDRDTHGSLYLPMDGSLVGSKGETPTTATGVSFAPGVQGQSATFGEDSQVLFNAAGRINPRIGTLSFWVRPHWPMTAGFTYTALSWDLWGGMLFLFGQNGGTWVRSILNRFGPNGTQEAGVCPNIGPWAPETWHHVAYTWNDGTKSVKAYVDGVRVAEATFDFPLPAVAAPEFQLGGDGVYNPLMADLDELRIADVERSVWEIWRESHAPLRQSTRLAFASCPAGSVAQAPFPVQPRVLAVDEQGNIDPLYSGPVTLAIKPGTGKAGAVLGGTTTVYAVSGVATFGGLSIDRCGYGYVLTAASTGLAPCDSAPFDVTPVTAPITRLVSIATDDGPANGRSESATLSADGRYACFVSGASNLVAGDTNGAWDVFVRDTLNGRTARASLKSNGAQGDGNAGSPVISADGHWVAFHTPSAMVSGDTNGATDVFLRDLDWSTTRVSVATGEAQANARSTTPSISGDGRTVAFETEASNLVANDTNGVWDICLRDLQGFTTTRVSVASDGTQANGHCGGAAISANGRFIAFHSPATNLVPGDTNGVEDVFIHDVQTGPTVSASVCPEGTQGNGPSAWPSISADGRYIAFESSAANLAPDDTNGSIDVFVRDTVSGVTTRVSVASDGAQADGVSRHASISADGRLVAFGSTASNLVPDDTNGVEDVFVHDRRSGITRRVSMAWEGAQGDGPSSDPFLSADGLQVTYLSGAANLVPQDTNGLTDVFVCGPLSVPDRRLTFATQPGGPVGNPLSVQPVVAVLDACGDVDLSFNGAVTISIKQGTGPTISVLRGTTTVNAVAGVAAFTDLRLEYIGAGYVLTAAIAASHGWITADSAPFDVTTHLPTVVRVDASAPGPVHDGTSWATALRTVQEGLDSAFDGDEVWVAKGAYDENMYTSTGTALYGGFAGTETDRDARDWKGNVTVLSGGVYEGRVVGLAGVGSRVDGFVIRNGYGYDGAGIGVYGTATISNNTITGNRADRGAGIGVYGTATISNNTITGNSADFGAGICVYGTATISNNTITGNSADFGGGGIYVGYGTATISNTIVAFNSSGVDTEGGTVTLKSNDVYSNTAYDYSGVTDPTGTNGNIKADPMLSSRYWNVHLQPGSPCVDAGDGGLVQAGDTDIDGQPRTQGAHVDIGSDESDGTTWPDLTRIYRVSTGGDDAADGLTWATAKRTVTAALASSLGGDEVWVAQGVYVENVSIPLGVALYGGFAGNETEQGQRNRSTNVTVLDGNQAGSVVTGSWYGAVVDGFTVRNGSAYTGGGIWVSGTATITNNTITGNRGTYGGGICVDGTATITNNAIIGNSGTYGGGICVDGTATISNNTLSGNSGAYRGGGIYVGYGTATISNNTITGNNASRYDGGGVFAYRDAKIANNTIHDNTSARDGGGIYVFYGTAAITSNAVYNNTAGRGGGAIHIDSGTATIINNTLCVNTAADGGGIHLNKGDHTICNNIIAHNTSGLYMAAGTVALRNNDTLASSTYNYSGVTDPTGTDGNISVEPLFLNRPAGDYRLHNNSPCRDAGDDSMVTPGQTDLDGHPRIRGPHVDIGAYEYRGIVRVNSGAFGPTHDGETWPTAFTSVQEGLDAAADGDEVWVAKRQYAEFGLTLRRSVSLYGGFKGDETERSQRDWTANETVLLGNVSGPVVNVDAAAGSVVVDGFTIRNGADGGISVFAQNTTIKHNVIRDNRAESGGYGGGVHILNGATTITNNLIRDNTSTYGGGICDSGQDPVIIANNTIVNNIAGLGGGVYVSQPSTSVTVANNIIASNRSGVHAQWEAATLRNNDVFGNAVSNFAGGIADPTGTRGNVSLDPLFADAPGGDYRLQAASLCINAGNDADVEPGGVDLVGNPRIRGPHVDMGAYEAPPVYRVVDAAMALRVAAGLAVPDAATAGWLDTESGGAGAVALSIPDAVRIIRKVAGIDANP